ncbi:putative galactarate transporter [Mycobacterium simulans]|uniref:Putative galactarate transporter n=1 Tax=Mycobacterium simulans TaxID=627089 RepID=A0A7Z7IK76_9MYCO|nr:MFS transporter [Mycobacterium simulans]SOJ54044.1 putative galactarate transporter [Mycobacterium simulans]SON62693.1 putative galactarate transporter [Mycobacterium simulans]
MRPWIIWGAGLLAYMVAVLDRTTMGVSGMDAAQRFSVTPGVLSTFVVVQVVVYAGAQIPAGVLLDRFGSKALICAGAVALAAGQLILAFAVSIPTAVAARAVVGLGDAVTFISVVKLVSYWFPPTRVPLVTQLTFIGGQLGQVLSAVPFLGMLTGAGWTAAYTSTAALGVMCAAIGLALIRDTPHGHDACIGTATFRELVASVRTVWSNPGTRLGFFIHLSSTFPIMVFSFMWGVPYLTQAQGMPTNVAGSLLTVSVVSTSAAGVVVGVWTGRHPKRRLLMVLAIVASNAVAWTAVLALPYPAPRWLLLVLVVVMSAGGPAAIVALDFARTHNPSATLGIAKGIVNMGGFVAALVIMPVMGLILEVADDYSFGSFRLAWTVQYPMWVLGVIAMLVTGGKAQRHNEIEHRQNWAAISETSLTADVD